MLNSKRIKPLGVLLSCCFVFCMSNEVFAASSDISVEYGGSEANSAKISSGDISNYETVLITKRSDGSMAYVGQEDGGFIGSAVSFLLKEGADYGLYDIKLGNSEGAFKTKYFYIGVDANSDTDVPMKRLTTTIEDNTTETTYYTAGFYFEAEADDFANYNSLIVGYETDEGINYGALEREKGGFPTVTNGSMVLVFELTEIEADELDSVSVFLSPATVGIESAYK